MPSPVDADRVLPRLRGYYAAYATIEGQTPALPSLLLNLADSWMGAGMSDRRPPARAFFPDHTTVGLTRSCAQLLCWHALVEQPHQATCIWFCGRGTRRWWRRRNNCAGWASQRRASFTEDSNNLCAWHSLEAFHLALWPRAITLRPTVRLLYLYRYSREQSATIAGESALSMNALTIICPPGWMRFLWSTGDPHPADPRASAARRSSPRPSRARRPRASPDLRRPPGSPS